MSRLIAAAPANERIALAVEFLKKASSETTALATLIRNSKFYSNIEIELDYIHETIDDAIDILVSGNRDKS